VLEVSAAREGRERARGESSAGPKTRLEEHSVLLTPSSFVYHECGLLLLWSIVARRVYGGDRHSLAFKNVCTTRQEEGLHRQRIGRLVAAGAHLAGINRAQLGQGCPPSSALCHISGTAARGTALAAITG
jgi:hypothetical protein